jgi:hypothetical protein
MIDGIDSYRGNELQWAVGTALENAQCQPDVFSNASAEELVEAVWDFIDQVFSEEGLAPPDKGKLINKVRKQWSILRASDG